MRTAAKALLARLAERSGFLRRRLGGRLVVLTFHRVRPDGEPAGERPMRNLEVPVSAFRDFLLWMRRRADPVALGEWFPGGGNGSAADKGKGGLPARRRRMPFFAVTFDDGWADNALYAAPVLEELRIPATIFLATGAVEKRIPFWWQVPGLPDEGIEGMKTLPPAQLEQRVREAPPAVRDACAREFLDWKQVREMARSGLVRFGLHGHRHALMTSLSHTEALDDICKCREILLARAPEAFVPFFAWPNGNVRADLAPALESLGMRGAFGTRAGVVAAGPVAGDGRWRLHRNNVDRHLAETPALWPWLLAKAAL
jgi:peptidoglycan/xylan/chitin deacetylase (PgdA/CDA1 family)